MTYANRSLVRDIVIKVRISERDSEKLDQLQQQTGEQKASLARDLLLAQLELALKAEKQREP